MKVYGNPPEECDVCKIFIDDVFIDGPTVMGSWSIMCPDCWGDYGGSDASCASAWIHEGDNKFVKSNEYKL